MTLLMTDAPPGSCPATFANEPHVDFSIQANRDAMRSAIERVRKKLGCHCPLVIDGNPTETPNRIVSVVPYDFAVEVGTTASAEAAHADQAVEAARMAQRDWKRRPAAERAERLRRLADLMRKEFFELAAWEVFESAKPWREATADVCEAIDFCEYYAEETERLASCHGADVPGEENRFVYLPRGIAAVIAPWNFPLAILTGMTAAALATGNAAIMKPAEQSSIIASHLMRLGLEAGIPPGVLHYLPGRGEEVGAALVEHPHVHLIAFTGSRDVGLAIHARAAAVSGRSCKFVKKVIAEMGGKNAIVVDRDADLDEAVAGVVYSAFGFQGQKCSACSRVVVLENVYDAFLRRLTEATRSLPVGPAEEPATIVSAVIDEEARNRILEYIALGREEGREVLGVDVGDLAKRGYYVGPHIFADIAPEARLAQEEIFGPVLAVLKASDLDEAFRIVNGVDYALTGGIYSRSPAHLDRARREIEVGNLYLNRGITGALVGRQPFGGFKLSGIGSKAGGSDYLLQYVLPKTITENTMRRGFAPPE
ncbi:MAG TPA: L-glutamate gamma-semialdehyde dehydrogenase [Planctomycetaceae bacterium]|nr:L-glutamate gamma-semialdehyde dehydrogenase [Planctomycetaceae bacterium]